MSPTPNQRNKSKSAVKKLKKRDLDNVHKKMQKPLWRGPRIDGVTSGLLSQFLICRERFRVLVVDGLIAKKGFSRPLHYGQMWHECEEALARNRDWVTALRNYSKELAKEFPHDRNEIDKWYNVCLVQFPIYINYWKDHNHTKNRKPLLEEVSFAVPYELDSGRMVLLRGKWDSVDLVGKQVWLQENKTKWDIREQDLTRQLAFDMQTSIYMTALKHCIDNGLMPELNDSIPKGAKLKGVRYNVIKRPLSGGKGSIRPHKATKNKPAETMPEFYARLSETIQANVDEFFTRFSVDWSSRDYKRAASMFINPILEALCDWWEWISEHPHDPWSVDVDGKAGSGVHWRTPFGFFNILAQGGNTDLDRYLDEGSMVGLTITNDLFPELD